MADKEVRELIDAIKSGEHGPEGLQVTTESSGHSKIYFRGQPVHERLEDGTQGPPLTLPSTPSDPTWYENTVRRLIRSRVLKEDPKKASQRGLTPEQEEEREAERRRREQNQERRQEEVQAQAEESKEKQANTTLLRQRAERIFDRIGVWKPSGLGKHGWRGTIAEVARVSFHWATANPRALEALYGTVPAEARVKEYWRRLFRDEPLVEEGRDFINAFVDELDRADNPTRLYNDLLRRLLGIKETRAPVPAAAKPGPEPEATSEESEQAVASVREVVAVVEAADGPVTSADIGAAIPDMTRSTRNWAAWKAADMGLIQKLARGSYAAIDYVPQDDEVPPEAPVGEATAIEEEVPLEMADLTPLLERLDKIAEDVERLQAGRSSNGAEPPTLALECLAEMIGMHVTVGPDEDGGISDGAFEMIEKKKARALELAKRVAELEVSGA